MYKTRNPAKQAVWKTRLPLMMESLEMVGAQKLKNHAISIENILLIENNSY